MDPELRIFLINIGMNAEEIKKAEESNMSRNDIVKTRVSVLEKFFPAEKILEVIKFCSEKKDNTKTQENVDPDETNQFRGDSQIDLTDNKRILASPKKTRMIEIQWENLDGGKYVKVPVSASDGARRPVISVNSSKSDIIKMAQELYFPSGCNRTMGSVKDYNTTICFKDGSEVDDNFTLEKHLKVGAYAKPVFIFVTRKCERRKNSFSTSNHDNSSATGQEEKAVLPTSTTHTAVDNYSKEKTSDKGCQNEASLFVGNLSKGTRKEDLEIEFGKFGKLIKVWVARNPPGFGFIEFSSKAEAENARNRMNGKEILGRKLTVEFRVSSGNKKKSSNFGVRGISSGFEESRNIDRIRAGKDGFWSRGGNRIFINGETYGIRSRRYNGSPDGYGNRFRGGVRCRSRSPIESALQ